MPGRRKTVDNEALRRLAAAEESNPDYETHLCFPGNGVMRSRVTSGRLGFFWHSQICPPETSEAFAGPRGNIGDTGSEALFPLQINVLTRVQRRGEHWAAGVFDSCAAWLRRGLRLAASIALSDV